MRDPIFGTIARDSGVLGLLLGPDIVRASQHFGDHVFGAAIPMTTNVSDMPLSETHTVV